MSRGGGSPRPFGEPSDEFCFGTLGGAAGRVPAAPRPRPPLPPTDDQFSRQYRRAEALRRHRHRLAVGGGQSARRSARPAISSSSTSSSTAPSRATRASSAPAASRTCRWRIRSAAGSATRSRRRGGDAGIAVEARRHLPGDGGAAILDPGRERTLPPLGLRRDRHDQHARGQARPRGGDLLRDGGDGDRLRLLAPRPRRTSPSR